jgi:hypothetical protein
MSLRFAAAGLICLLAPYATAADTETRMFNVTVDGRPAGEFRMTIRTGDDGAEAVTLSADVRVRQIIGGYRYSYRGSEAWNSGRLRQFDAASDDNGKKHTIRATADGDKLRLTADGVSRAARPDLWPTSYWRLPAVKAGQAVALLDADTGEEQVARVDSLAASKITVAGKPADVTRVHVTAPTPADLWYDARGRLVRQETVEDGHKTILELREIQK